MLVLSGAVGPTVPQVLLNGPLSDDQTFKVNTSEKFWQMDANTDHMVPPAEPARKQRNRNILIRDWKSRRRLLRRCLDSFCFTLV